MTGIETLDMNQCATIPMHSIGPVKIISSEIDGLIKVPLATLEAPLWPSVNRGAKVSRESHGIHVQVLKDCMTRSILLQASDLAYANEVIKDLEIQQGEFASVVTTTSQYAKLQSYDWQIVGNLLYLRFSFSVGDAAGHNMATQAADVLLSWLLNRYRGLKHISVSGNYCIDKKVSAVNGILGRGKYVVAELTVPGHICAEVLKTTPGKIVEVNIKKNLIGSILAGGVRTANAHFANMLLAFYLATGQDAANIVEGSQGLVNAELKGDDLYFSVTLPNIIVGTVGTGKNLPFASKNLKELGCLEEGSIGGNARRLAVIAAAAVLCGELSLLAALTNQGELMRAHVTIERK